MVKTVALLIDGGGAHGESQRPTIPDERSSLVPTSDALQLMLGFGMFVIALIALVVELIKLQQKK